MTANTFGEIFRVTTFGESHGGAVGAVIDGCPPGLEISIQDIQQELDRRRPGQSALTTERSEEDSIIILSGVFEGRTLGTPILLLANNKDARPGDYEPLKEIYRPSHADFTVLKKYGIRDWRGGGRASARETLARVAAGAVAQKYLRNHFGFEALSYVEQIGSISAPLIDPDEVRRDAIEATRVRCPDHSTALEMEELIEKVKGEGDSIGGVIKGVLRGVPIGLGEPVFDKLHADLAKAVMSINAAKGFEIGLGFSATTLKGSEHNDPFEQTEDGAIRTQNNRAGGVIGGISTGETIWFRVAFKPTSTIKLEQETVSTKGDAVTLKASGRHDPCVLPRAVPIVDAMASLVIMDHLLRQRAQNG